MSALTAPGSVPGVRSRQSPRRFGSGGISPGGHFRSITSDWHYTSAKASTCEFTVNQSPSDVLALFGGAVLGIGDSGVGKIDLSLP
ncbi:hypothetical protein J1605_013406 [Eschrichtius robustus]|uniref:Uncharacterized protein n=1 Tax=Eschrichtius robustus TaxID=9764 RepID=A0AB34GK26_ESCRO|nr:hypothetical protein J1605_013406 [Eschrichtius robustus]